MKKPFSKIFSKNPDEILDGLFSITNENTNLVDKELSGRIRELFCHPDVDIRQQSVIVAGLKLKDRRYYQEIFKMLSDKNGETNFLISVVYALGTLVSQMKGPERVELSNLLAKTVLDENNDNELRGVCYLNLRRINDQITQKEYAASPEDINELDIDINWIKKFVRV
jgi:hypothetical protein